MADKKLFQKWFVLSAFGVCALGILNTPELEAATATAVPKKTGRVLIDRLDASVNAVPILKSDLAKFRTVVKLRAQLDPLFAGTPLADKGANATDQEITEFFIDEKLITQLFPASDSEVEQEIGSIRTNNNLDQNALETALARQGFKYTDYYELIRTGISKRNLINAEIRSKVNITDDDVNHELNIKDKVAASGPREVQLQMIKIPTKDYKTSELAFDAATRARKALAKGESFSEVAKQYNPDGSTGELAALPEDQMDKGFREQLKTLKIGETSPVFGGKAAGYYVILKLLSASVDDSKHLTKIKEEIRARLAAKEFQRQLSMWQTRQRQSAFIHHVGESTTKEIPIVQ